MPSDSEAAADTGCVHPCPVVSQNLGYKISHKDLRLSVAQKDSQDCTPESSSWSPILTTSDPEKVKT